MGAVRLALPAFLLVFFITRSVKQRIFLLGIPFLMYMSSSVFFDKVKIFWVPSRLSSSDLVMLWLVITWVVYFDLVLPAYRRGRPRPLLFGPALSGPEEAMVLGFAALAVLELGLTALRFGELGAALGEARAYIYLFVGYFLLRGMLCRASRSDTLDFLKALVIVNTVAAGLFILHQGLHLQIYQATEYQVISFMGQRLTRSFYFMPQLLALALAYVFARRTWSVFWLGVMIVTLGALWVSYTRSLLLIAAAELVAILCVRLLKARQAGMVIKRVVAIVLIVVVLGVVVLVALPVQSQYFFSRIGMATSSGSLTSDPNMQNRANKMRTIYKWIADESHAFGQGFVTAGQDPAAASVDVMASDLVWVPVLYRFGVLGVVVVALLYVTAAWQSLRLSLGGAGEAEFMALLLLGLIVGLFLEGFVSWTFLNPARYPMGFWFLALLAAETCRRRAEVSEGVFDD